MLGIAVACMPTLRPLFISMTESAQIRWRYWTERSSKRKNSTMTRSFGRYKGGFENIEYGTGDIIPMRPRDEYSV